MGNAQRKSVFKKVRLKENSKGGRANPCDILQIHNKSGGGVHPNSGENPTDPQSSVCLSPDCLTLQEINHIKATWIHIKKDLNKILMETFLILFTENADIKDKFFDFKNYSIEDLKKTVKGGSSLQRHIPRVARVMMKVMNRINNLSDVKDYFQVLGKLHHQNGITLPELIPFGPVFLNCSVHYFPLSQRSNIDITNSWIRLFLYLNEMMRGGYPDTEYELNKEERTIISRTHAILKRTRNNPTESSKKNDPCLQTEFSNFALSKIYLPLFRVVYEKEILSENIISKHWELMNDVVNEFVSNMEDRSKLELIFVNLGAVHDRAGIRKSFLEVMSLLYCKTIRLVLVEESEWGPEVSSAWFHLFRVIVFQMKRGYTEDHSKKNELDMKEESSRSQCGVVASSPLSKNINRTNRSRSVTPSISPQLTIDVVPELSSKARRVSMEEIRSPSPVYCVNQISHSSMKTRNLYTEGPVSKSAQDISVGTEKIPMIKLLPSASSDDKTSQKSAPPKSLSLISKNRRLSCVSVTKSPRKGSSSLFEDSPILYQSSASLITEERRKSHQDYISTSSMLTIPSPGSQRPRSKSDASRTLSELLNGFITSKSSE